MTTEEKLKILARNPREVEVDRIKKTYTIKTFTVNQLVEAGNALKNITNNPDDVYIMAKEASKVCEMSTGVEAAEFMKELHVPELMALFKAVIDHNGIDQSGEDPTQKKTSDPT